MKLKIKKLNKKAKLPKYAHDGDAGMDIYSLENHTIKANSGHLFKVGFALEIPDDYFGFIKERSSLGMRGIIVAGGIIDSGYRGEIIVSLFNSNNKLYKIEKNDKIAQIIIVPTIQAEIKEVKKLADSSRGKGGFGSTGR